VVDVAADDAVGAALLRFARQRLLERADIADRALDLQLEVARQRPVRQAGARPHRVQARVQAQQELVDMVADVGEPPGALDDAVAEVAVRHP